MQGDWRRSFYIFVYVGLLLSLVSCGASDDSVASLLVSSGNNFTVKRYDGTTGAFLGIFASGFGLIEPKGMVFGPDGNLYVSSFSFDPTQATANQVLRFNGSGQPLPASGQTGATFVAIHSGGLTGPFGLVFGTDGNLYVSSLLTNQVLRYNGTTGAFLGIFASGGGLDGPVGLAFTQ